MSIEKYTILRAEKPNGSRVTYERVGHMGLLAGAKMGRDLGIVGRIQLEHVLKLDKRVIELQRYYEISSNGQVLMEASWPEGYHHA